MLIAAVHLSPWATIPAALAVATILAWYWRRVGRIDAAQAPRRIRRLSILIMLLSLPNFVRGLSFLDPAVQKGAYLVSWSISLLLVLIVMLAAGVDAMLTIRLHRRRLHHELSFAAGTLLDAAKRPGTTPDPAPDPAAGPAGDPAGEPEGEIS